MIHTVHNTKGAFTTGLLCFQADDFFGVSLHISRWSFCVYTALL